MRRNSFSTHFKKRNLVFKFCLTIILLQNHKWFHYSSQIHGSQMFRPPSASWSCHVSGDCDGTVVLWAPSYHIGLNLPPAPHPPSAPEGHNEAFVRLRFVSSAPRPLPPTSFSLPVLFPLSHRCSQCHPTERLWRRLCSLFSAGGEREREREHKKKKSLRRHHGKWVVG